MISWNCSTYESDLIFKIAARAETLLSRRMDRMKLVMDLENCHCNGCPLDLAGLLGASDGDFRHDISGIVAHIDRQEGGLTDSFLPRYALCQHSAVQTAQPYDDRDQT